MLYTEDVSWTIYVSCIAVVGKIRFPLRNIWRDELGCPSKWVGGAIDEARLVMYGSQLRLVDWAHLGVLIL